MGALQQHDARGRAADQAAAAQASFDCWVEQAAGGRSRLAAACRDPWRTTMVELDLATPPQVMPAAAPPAHPSAPLPSHPRRLEGFFKAGSTWLDRDSRRLIADLLADPRSGRRGTNGRPGTNRIAGHADRTGPADLNEQLAWARAAAVADVLVDGGVGVERLELLSMGEAVPQVPTSAEVGHPHNRRVVIELL